MPDKYSAVWTSHSSLSDFRRCPKSYYYKNVYKSPITGHKIQVMSPALALGQSVHAVLEALSVKPVSERFSTSLLVAFSREWEKISGKQGGFSSSSQEKRFRDRGETMLERVTQHPGPLERLSIKIKTDLPQYWLSTEDEIILCGKIDWLEYIAESDAVRIIDFKTGVGKEDSASLQLPIYRLLVHNIQKRQVAGASYWYIEQSDEPVEKVLPVLTEAHEAVLQEAKKVKLARKLQHFPCPEGESGCRYCQPLKDAIDGKATKVGESMGRDVYVFLTDSQDEMVYESELI